MTDENLSISARAEMGEPVCQLYLRPSAEIPGGLWSWRTYVNGSIHARGPGSTRRDILHWYGTLLRGPYRIVLREPDVSKPDRVESNTLMFRVDAQPEITIDVSYRHGAMLLELAPESQIDA
jgi:hypothetical protein